MSELIKVRAGQKQRRGRTGLGGSHYLAPTRSSCRLPVDVLINTGTEGGNYASESFVRSVERNARGGGSIVSSKGKGLLRAANPIQSGVPP